jgi:hypothetical protein
VKQAHSSIQKRYLKFKEKIRKKDMREIKNNDGKNGYCSCETGIF